MDEFLNTYEARKNELNLFLRFLRLLENREKDKGNDNKVTSKDLVKTHYTVMINALKSSFVLMLYNIIEFVITQLLYKVFDTIEKEKLCYEDVNLSLQKLWNYTNLKKKLKDDNANLNTALEENERLIKFVVEKRTLQFNPKDTMARGSLDGKNIKTTFQNIGMNINENSYEFRPDILNSIKTCRNELAHGEISFGEGSRDFSIKDLECKKNIILGMLDYIVYTTNVYLKQKKYFKVSR